MHGIAVLALAEHIPGMILSEIEGREGSAMFLEYTV
jgi:hypothetical protein